MRLPLTRFTVRSLKLGTIVLAGVILTLGIRRLGVWGISERRRLEFYDVKLATKSLIPDKRGGRDVLISDRLVEVSLIQLISSPERYHGQAVRLSGFLHVEFEGTGIYLSREDANYLINRNGLWVSFDSGDWSAVGMTPRQFNRKYVLIEGFFDKDNHGHMGAWSGAVRSVWRAMEEQRYYED
jgi:hypothetical protein